MAFVLLNKPYRVLCQFRDDRGRATLADYVSTPAVYPAGRLDYDSEGLLVLTDDGALQAKIADPASKLDKAYWVQVEGSPDSAAIDALCNGVALNDGDARAVSATLIEEPPQLWPREPPIRERRHIPTAWLELVIDEGRNRQVRRMTAAVGLPTLRLVRHRVGPWELGELQPGAIVEMATASAWRRLDRY